MPVQDGHVFLLSEQYIPKRRNRNKRNDSKEKKQQSLLGTEHTKE
jgi:hypothetical protein